MICPNCKENVSDRMTHCNHCNENLTLYKKITRISNIYYNRGLAKAKVRDLTGAISDLRYSLELNKTNINARNLLGLIYLEVGETVSALSEWVISRHLEPNDNDADRYIDEIQFNPTMLDSLNQAVKRYNNALSFAKQGSDDLAIIQLKRVVALNPGFIRAYQLLALLYMKNNDNERAKSYLFQAAQIDVSNTRTLAYMKKLLPDKEVAKVVDGSQKPEENISSTIIPISSYQEEKPNIMAFVNLVIGIILGIAVTAFLIMPSIDKGKSGGDNDDIDYSASLEKYQEQEAEITGLRQEKEDLSKQVEKLQNQIKDIEIMENDINSYDALFNAISLYNTEMEKYQSERDYNAIADALLLIEEDDYQTESAVHLLESLKEEIYPIVTEDYYRQGHNLYSNFKYEEALVELKKAYEIDPNHVNSIYFIARAYHRLEDYENAAIYYDIIVRDFSDTNRYGDAKSFLDEVSRYLEDESGTDIIN